GIAVRGSGDSHIPARVGSTYMVEHNVVATGRLRPPVTANKAASIEIAGYEAGTGLHPQRPVGLDDSPKPLESGTVAVHGEASDLNLGCASDA
ncbi:MAG: hypothetical protein WB902_02140, partial [Acetobacteraceae bacterium]